MLTHNSILTAKYLLAASRELANRQLNVTQTQKLLYIAYGFGLKYHGVSLVDEKPKLWPYGPVFPKTRGLDYGAIYHTTNPEFSAIRGDEHALTLLNTVAKQFAQNQANVLSAWSHKKGGPWDITRNRPDFKWNMPISDDVITDYFKKLRLYAPSGPTYTTTSTG